RVEVLGAVQGAAEAFDRVALGPAGDAAAEGAVEADVRLAGDQFAGGVEQPGGRADALGEALAQVVHAALELGGGRGAGLRVAGDVQEVGVVAVRVRVAGLVEVGRADRAEGAGVSGELVDGARLKAGAVGLDRGRAGQRGAGDPLVLGALAESVDGAERVGRRCVHDLRRVQAGDQEREYGCRGGPAAAPRTACGSGFVFVPFLAVV